MLKKLLTAILLLIASTAANAELMRSINGSFDVVGVAYSEIGVNGEFIGINFTSEASIIPPTLAIVTGDYAAILTATSTVNLFSFDLADLAFGDTLLTVDGFTFTFKSLDAVDQINSTSDTYLTSTYSFRIIGDVSHADFTTTESQFILSTQNLREGINTAVSFSSVITSPPIVSVPVSEPGTLAIFAVGFIALGLRRKKKTV